MTSLRVLVRSLDNVMLYMVLTDICSDLLAKLIFLQCSLQIERLTKMSMEVSLNGLSPTYIQYLVNFKNSNYSLRHKHLERSGLLPESQCGFRKNRGTIDMIFTARQLQEKCQEQNVDLYMTFVDLTKAFDTVSREGLWKFWQSLVVLPNS